jgi:hypothetical protein
MDALEKQLPVTEIGVTDNELLGKCRLTAKNDQASAF